MVFNFGQGAKWTTSVYESPVPSLPFPDLILCNFNRLSNHKVQAYNMSMDIVEYLMSSFVVRYTTGNPQASKETVEKYKVRV